MLPAYRSALVDTSTDDAVVGDICNRWKVRAATIGLRGPVVACPPAPDIRSSFLRHRADFLVGDRRLASGAAPKLDDELADALLELATTREDFQKMAAENKKLADALVEEGQNLTKLREEYRLQGEQLAKANARAADLERALTQAKAAQKQSAAAAAAATTASASPAAAAAGRSPAGTAGGATTPRAVVRAPSQPTTAAAAGTAPRAASPAALPRYPAAPARTPVPVSNSPVRRRGF